MTICRPKPIQQTPRRLLLTALLCFFSIAIMAKQNTEDPFHWDNPECTVKPWARWWWLGSAVTEQELTRQLTALHEAGFGGVEIQPIYAAENSPVEPIPYLSERWGEVLKHTLLEAERLGMGVDMTLGSGWPFGGPWLEEKHAARKIDIEIQKVSESTEWVLNEDPLERINALVIRKEGETGPGELIEPEKIFGSGQATWMKAFTIPEGDWELYIIRIGYTGQKVKRATVGSEGPVLDHFSQEAFVNYVQPFEERLKALGPIRPRANFNDSFEVYGANWTPDLVDEFQKRNGYNLLKYFPVLQNDPESDIGRRVLHDYRETVQNLFYEDFCLNWKKWSSDNGMKIRFQAHGSPGHLLDLYAVADISETEGFGKGGIEIPPAKMASSAAHLFDKKYVSSETFTWLDEHFQVTLDRMRTSVDDFFLAGVNHVFYHGVPYWPKDSVPYPGWLFYASTNAGEQATWFHHLHHLNAYITRAQSVLQAGRYDSDILLFYPIHDLFMYAEGAKDNLQYCTAHNSKNWLYGAAEGTAEAAEVLWENGYQFDYASDRLVSGNLIAKEGNIECGTSDYRALIFSGCRWVDLSTLEAIAKLAEEGATVLFIGEMPIPYPRTGDPSNNASAIPEALAQRFKKQEQNGHVQRIDNKKSLDEALAKLNIKHDTMAKQGLEFVRRKDGDTTLYFIKNRAGKAFQDWVHLAADGNSAVMGDPVTGRITSLPKRDSDGAVYLQLEPTRACVLAVGNDFKAPPHPESITGRKPSIEFDDNWMMHWQDMEGNSQSVEMVNYGSWTNTPGLELFSGTVRYENSFTLQRPPETTTLTLTLGELHESADVSINGQYVGTVWTRPYQLRIPAPCSALKKGKNTISIDVTNLSANRMIDLDRQGVNWKNFYFVDIDYEPFDASKWEPLPSGIIGPVRLDYEN